MKPSSSVDMELSALRGLCEGILADGRVSDEETHTFHLWVKRAAAAHPVWPLTDILTRLQRIFADGVCDEEERAELKAVMESLCGRGAERTAGAAAQGLPLDDPAPPVIFAGKEFVVTGEFAYGKRGRILEAIADRGGLPRDAAPRLSTDYLVIGAMASDQWKHSSYGRKIQAAMDLNSKGARIAVISEEHWRNALGTQVAPKQAETQAEAIQILDALISPREGPAEFGKKPPS